MQEIIDSDFDLTMLANKSFYHIIDEIQSSCLNFQLQLSPFSAVISLMKSLIRDPSGKPLLPSKPKYEALNDHIKALEIKKFELEQKLKHLTIKNER